MSASRQLANAISAEQQEKFDRDGYVVLDPGISEQTIEGAKSDLGDKFAAEGETWFDEFGVKYRPGKNPAIQEAWKVSDAVKEITLAPKILASLEQLFGGLKPLPFQTINFPFGSEQGAHADGMYFNSYPLGYMCGVWVALEDIDMDNGPLVYYPGSHKLPIPTPEEIGDPDRSDFESFEDFMTERVRRYQDFVVRQIEENDLQPEYGTIKKGQALVWAAHLIHGGTPQKDKDRTRHSQVTHYYFEGDFRQFCPLQVVEGRKRWDYPTWISDDVPLKVTADVVRETVKAHVPEGSTVLVTAPGDAEMREIEGRTVLPFPQRQGNPLWYTDLSAEEAIESLEKLREEGASYLVVPGPEGLRMATLMSDVQHYIEDHYKTVVRNGATCIIFSLN